MSADVPTGSDLTTLHATTVAIDDKGVLIIGPSGAGKSALALQLIALGAQLVADDKTQVWAAQGQVFAKAPDAISGKVEARGIGILHIPALSQVALSLVVDMTTAAETRLPDPQIFALQGHQLPCFRKVNGPHLAPAILLLAQGAYLNPHDPI